MHGLVNRGLQDLICKRFGEATWESICRRASVDIGVFLSHRSYPDEVTYALVGAASEELEMSADDLLRAFGRHWILYTAQEGYGALLDMTGQDLATFLHNLDQMHPRVTLNFPDLQPPSYRCEELGPGLLRLHYHSHRPGLTPLALGLLRGLAERLGVDAQIEVEPPSGGGETARFLIRWAARAPPSIS